MMMNRSTIQLGIRSFLFLLSVMVMLVHTHCSKLEGSNQPSRAEKTTSKSEQQVLDFEEKYFVEDASSQNERALPESLEKSPEVHKKRENLQEKTPEKSIPELLEPYPEKRVGDKQTLKEPPIPVGLKVYHTGSRVDKRVSPRGPGLILMGGGPEVDDAFRWWKPLIQGGDVVILRTSGSNGYNDYLYRQIGGCHSVTTMLVTTRGLANSAYVQWRLARAEGIFIAGGNQSTYIKAWKGTLVESELRKAWSRNAVIGGTSAGLAVLGEFVFDAHQGGATSSQLLADPFHSRMSLTRGFLIYPPLKKVITDSHFARRGRMGRLIAFMARIYKEGWSHPVTGLGIDERTALVIDAHGNARVMGRGAVYLLRASSNPSVCEPKKAIQWSKIIRYRYKATDSFLLNKPSAGATLQLSVSNGRVFPTNHY